MKWKSTEMGNGRFLYEQVKPEPLGFVETYILLSTIALLTLALLVVLFA